MDAAQGLEELAPGKFVVHTTSGYSGEIYQMFSWGVQVWVPDRGNERENWSWPMITKRYPRLVKRYPRPFRWPRDIPTEQCHCKIGRMEVEGEHEVRCTRCKKLIGSEAFPNRFKRASFFLRKAYSPKSKNKISPRVERRTKRKASRRGKNKRRAPPRGVGVRRSRRGEATKRHGKTRRSKTQHQGNRKVSPARKRRPPTFPSRKKKR